MGKSNLPGGDMADEARRRAEELKEKGQQTAQQTAEQAKQKGREAADKARDWSETGMEDKQGNQPR